MRFLLLGFCLFLVLPAPLLAYEAYNGEKVPPLTRAEGRVNLDHEWIVHHGARLYWRSVQIPKQVRLAGMEFQDPAALPVLDMKNTCDDSRKRSYRRGKRRVRDCTDSTKRTVRRKKAPVATKTAQAKPIPPMKQPPKRALGPAKRRSSGGSAQQLPMKPVDPVGNPLQ